MTGKTFDAFSAATDMLWALQARQVSAVQLLELHIKRIQRYDPDLNAVVVKNYERARRDAAAADAARAHGDEAPLLGLPMTVKESIDVKGLPTTGGSPDRADHRAVADALTVRRLRAAGAVILGKTNTCLSLSDFQGENAVYGRTNNPWDFARTPGGSAAGSAALAAGMSPVELGSDLAGALRGPAAFCGLYGHKPSDGLVPTTGQYPGFDGPNPAANLVVQGPHGRSPADLELILDTIVGPEAGADVAWRVQLPSSRHYRLADFRVAILPPQEWLPVDPEIWAAQDALAERLANVRACVAHVRPEPLGDLRDYYRLFRSMQWGLTSARWTGDQRRAALTDKLRRDDEFHKADARGIGASAGDWLTWHEQRETYRAAWREFFRHWDVLITPATLAPAFRHSTNPNTDRRLHVAGRKVEFEYTSFYPALATLAGQPATVIPAGRTENGLPIGLQVIGPYLEDRTTLTFARLLEREWGGFQPPPGFGQRFGDRVSVDFSQPVSGHGRASIHGERCDPSGGTPRTPATGRGVSNMSRPSSSSPQRRVYAAIEPLETRTLFSAPMVAGLTAGRTVPPVVGSLLVPPRIGHEVIVASAVQAGQAGTPSLSACRLMEEEGIFYTTPPGRGAQVLAVSPYTQMEFTDTVITSIT